MTDRGDASQGRGGALAADGSIVGNLHAWLAARIAETGPISVETFMQICLTHSEYGYYRRRRAIGADGDFVTAPEISQVFGELVGVWSAAVYQQMGSPDRVRLVELGPGRGTLMADALRALAVVPSFLERVQVQLVEISEALTARQRHVLADAPVPVDWSSALEPFDGATILLANEFLDALPVRQLVFDGMRWRERAVGRDEMGALCFAVLADDPTLDGIALPEQPRTGDVLETRRGTLAGSDGLVAQLAAAADAGPLAGLFIDYGYEGPLTGDTLQAVRSHRYESPLSCPGAADLTAHVDFGEFARLVADAGLSAFGPVTQAAFLSRLGIEARAARLLAGAAAAQANRIESGIARLMAPEGMGGRFRAMALASPTIGPPPPF